MLTLSEALKTDRLADFVAQQEAAGLSPAEREAFDRVVRAAVKPAKVVGRTSRSRTGDGSSGSRTRRGRAAASLG
jgi:hypothetical protein